VRDAQLNPGSSVLRCHLGMALAKMNRTQEALACLDQAIASDSGNPLARFERAGVLLGQERFTEALAELEALRVRPRPLLRPTTLMFACVRPAQALQACLLSVVQ
jgi:tetratricopeptide (TPR) repeat protein